MKKSPHVKKLNEILGISFFLIGIFTLASLIFHHPDDHPFFTSHPNRPLQNPTGVVGVYLSHYFLLLFGYSAYFISLVAIFWSICHFLQRVPEKKLVKVVGFSFLLVASSGLFSLATELRLKALHGGLIGYLIDTYLEKYFGFLGASILMGSFLLLSLLLATDFFLFPIVGFVFQTITSFVKGIFGSMKKIGSVLSRVSGFLITRRSVLASAKKTVSANPKREKIDHEIEKSFFDKELAIKVKKYEPSIVQAVPAESKLKGLSERPPRENIKAENSPPKQERINVQEASSVSLKDYALPPLSFLKVPPGPRKGADQDLTERSRLLEATLRDFDIEARVVEIEQGPTVTRYELMPAPGVKVSSIVSLSDDLALALKAASVRIIAPIPGKAAVGIEVPNSITDTVFLRELLESSGSAVQSCRLPLTLGKDTSGKPLIADLTEMPHLLIAGTTGSGKTVCVNSIIAGLLYTRRPDNLKFVMVDPKMVELSIYNHLPHMLTPVVTDIRKAAATLNWVVNEMDSRYKLLAACTVRNVQAFNERDRKNDPPDIPEHLPYIVVVIDELADLMVVAQDKVETAITRLAQLSRAVGIHLVLATQRPSVDVITGVIKANFPARISFKVASKVDSRTVLDMNGADKLLGKGDMLFLEPGSSKPTRGQAALVTDQEISQIVKFISQQRQAEYKTDLEKIADQGFEISPGEKDELYQQAVKVVVETRQASTSILQRRLRLGYGRAARILDMMESEGIVGPPQGTKPREVLVERLTDVS